MVTKHCSSEIRMLEKLTCIKCEEGCYCTYWKRESGELVCKITTFISTYNCTICIILSAFIAYKYIQKENLRFLCFLFMSLSGRSVHHRCLCLLGKETGFMEQALQLFKTDVHICSSPSTVSSHSET